jgi:spore coat polysaccharide biosynthesis protein SpsF
VKTSMFVQARLNSKRIQKKMLLEIEGKTILEHSFLAAKKVFVDNYVLLTTKEDVSCFEKIAERNGFEIFIGNENDVLNRFASAIKKYEPDYVVRMTGDKVILSEHHQKVLQEMIRSCSYELVSYDEDPLRSVTAGVYSSKYLLRADVEAKKKESREHVKPSREEINCNYKVLQIPKYLRKYSIDFSIDTEEDLTKIRNIFKVLYDGNPIAFSKLIEYIEENDYPETNIA